jgi:hypothetical protein
MSASAGAEADAAAAPVESEILYRYHVKATGDAAADAARAVMLRGFMTVDAASVRIIPHEGETKLLITAPFIVSAKTSKDTAETSEADRYRMRLAFRASPTAPASPEGSTVLEIKFCSPSSYAAAADGSDFATAPAAVVRVAAARKIKVLIASVAPAAAPTAAPSAAGPPAPAAAATAPTATTPAAGAGATAAVPAVPVKAAAPRPAAPRVVVTAEERALREAVLKNDPETSALYTQLVERDHAVSAHDFWAVRQRVLRDEATSLANQKQPVSAGELSAILTDVRSSLAAASQALLRRPGGAAATAAAATAAAAIAAAAAAAGPQSVADLGPPKEVAAHLCLAQNPIVLRAFRDNVPHKMTEEAFWDAVIASGPRAAAAVISKAAPTAGAATAAAAAAAAGGGGSGGETALGIFGDAKRALEFEAASQAPGARRGARKQVFSELISRADSSLDLAATKGDHFDWGAGVGGSGAAGEDVDEGPLPADVRDAVQRQRRVIARINAHSRLVVEEELRHTPASAPAAAAAATPTPGAGAMLASASESAQTGITRTLAAASAAATAAEAVLVAAPTPAPAGAGAGVSAGATTATGATAGVGAAGAAPSPTAASGLLGGGLTLMSVSQPDLLLPAQPKPKLITVKRPAPPAPAGGPSHHPPQPPGGPGPGVDADAEVQLPLPPAAAAAAAAAKAAASVSWADAKAEAARLAALLQGSGTAPAAASAAPTAVSVDTADATGVVARSLAAAAAPLLLSQSLSGRQACLAWVQPSALTGPQTAARYLVSVLPALGAVITVAGSGAAGGARAGPGATGAAGAGGSGGSELDAPLPLRVQALVAKPAMARVKTLFDTATELCRHFWACVGEAGHSAAARDKAGEMQRRLSLLHDQIRLTRKRFNDEQTPELVPALAPIEALLYRVFTRWEAVEAAAAGAK